MKKKERRRKYSEVDLYINTAYKDDEFDYDTFIQNSIGDNYEDLVRDTDVDKRTISDTNDNTSTDGTAANFPNIGSNLYVNTNKDDIKNPFINTKELTTDENPYVNPYVNTNVNPYVNTKYDATNTNSDVPSMTTFKD